MLVAVAPVLRTTTTVAATAAGATTTAALAVGPEAALLLLRRDEGQVLGLGDRDPRRRPRTGGLAQLRGAGLDGQRRGTDPPLAEETSRAFIAARSELLSSEP